MQHNHLFPCSYAMMQVNKETRSQRTTVRLQLQVRNCFWKAVAFKCWLFICWLFSVHVQETALAVNFEPCSWCRYVVFNDFSEIELCARVQAPTAVDSVAQFQKRHWWNFLIEVSKSVLARSHSRNRARKCEANPSCFFALAPKKRQISIHLLKANMTRRAI